MSTVTSPVAKSSSIALASSFIYFPTCFIIKLSQNPPFILLLTRGIRLNTVEMTSEIKSTGPHINVHTVHNFGNWNRYSNSIIIHTVTTFPINLFRFCIRLWLNWWILWISMWFCMGKYFIEILTIQTGYQYSDWTLKYVETVMWRTFSLIIFSKWIFVYVQCHEFCYHIDSVIFKMKSREIMNWFQMIDEKVVLFRVWMYFFRIQNII